MLKFKEIKWIKFDGTKKVDAQKDKGSIKTKPEGGMTMLEAICFWDEITNHRGV